MPELQGADNSRSGGRNDEKGKEKNKADLDKDADDESNNSSLAV
jgi:hypothetical protein